MAAIPCFLCGNKLEKRTDKNEKPYFVCDPCGIQMFVRRQAGIERLEQFIEVVKQQQVSLAEHSYAVVEIQGILNEIRGVKREIETLDGEIGIFFQDREKTAAKESLKKRLKTLLGELEAKAKTSRKH
ncbi:MAG TPA: hypothetical protein VG892_05330 [Terriglobales bacterium]|jgi:hypothetical protein|nr:hypothetical protein [Terriglobales bacterium]